MKPNEVILRTVTKVAIFILFTFAIYLFLAGHHNPGGGFIGGLVVVSVIVLLLMAYDLKRVREGLPFDFKVISALGVLLAVTTGMGSFLFDKPFLSHTTLYLDLPFIEKMELATAVIFDVGVALAVIGTALSIISTISEDIVLWKR